MWWWSACSTEPAYPQPCPPNPCPSTLPESRKYCIKVTAERSSLQVPFKVSYGQRSDTLGKRSCFKKLFFFSGVNLYNSCLCWSYRKNIQYFLNGWEVFAINNNFKLSTNACFQKVLACPFFPETLSSPQILYLHYIANGNDAVLFSDPSISFLCGLVHVHKP